MATMATSAFVSSNIHAPMMNPATSSTKLDMTNLAYNGKKQNFKAGTKLSAACAKLGVKPRYSCKKGDCGSCTISVGGQRVKACVGKVPPEPRLKSLQEKGLEIK
eukprot:CAMPEP_0195518364 /NCGR_PEP_ID=MMETSP0794_2-20130614/12716_1 /TAXON_ID=515487 /ORGANISM="Stephanopyxis turris, Strain CCMP 815" /LENGTH=104 /DNA_ID=CAMNT_0040647313 /DNA_START=84 /DNA_END=398 /DNA_ORIENTATION=+